MNEHMISGIKMLESIPILCLSLSAFLAMRRLTMKRWKACHLERLDWGRAVDS
ncbi:hypothetical protein O9929_21150 [Vibrio lentus]|nr:hypothetical protein [Vibrio lentus]